MKAQTAGGRAAMQGYYDCTVLYCTVRVPLLSASALIATTPVENTPSFLPIIPGFTPGVFN